LDSHNQRDWLTLRRFIETRGLFDAIVFHDEILGRKTIHNFALLVFHQRRNQHYIRLGANRSFLRECAGG
jgi:hypothetical protein